MAGDDTCCICLDSLFCPDTILGVTTPCGHPIHEACFRGWEANKMQGRGDYFRRSHDLKCPTCNTPGVSFTKIFISFPTNAAGGGGVSDDDDSTVESVALDDKVVDEADNDAGEKESNQEQEGNEEGNDPSSRDSDSSQQDPGPINDDTVQPMEVEDVVDLTGDTEPERREAANLTSSNNNNSRQANRADRTEEANAYRRKAKRYKKLCKQLKSKYGELGQQQHELHKLVKSAKDDAQSEKQKADQLQEDHDRHMHELREAQLEVIRLEREREAEEDAKEAAQRKLHLITKEYAQAKASFQKKIDDARKSHNVEMDKIIKDYPKVLDQKQQLEAELDKKIKYVANLKKRLQTLEPRLRMTIEQGLQAEGAPPDQRQKKKNLALMNAMSDEHQTTEVLLRNKRHREAMDLPSKARKKSTPRAVHMVECATAKKHAAHPAIIRTSHNMDRVLDGPTKRQPLGARRVSTDNSAAAAAGSQPVRQPPSSSSAASTPSSSSTRAAKPAATTLSLTKRNHTKSSDRRQGAFSKKSSKPIGQGDIRFMFQPRR